MNMHKNILVTLAAVSVSCIFSVVLCGRTFHDSETGKGKPIRLIDLEKKRVLESAKACLEQEPTPITSFYSRRSAGGRHDYFSEGDYWWPDPKNPKGPYVRRDGETNPNNFIEHRHALMQLGIQAAELASAYRITGDEAYARHAVKHLRTWFVNPNTIMNPHLQYAQAIQGVCTGRGTGIIDTIHLVEVVKAIQALESSKALTPVDLEALRKWFRAYLQWVTTSQYGIDERDSKNNHSSAWVFQVAAFAQMALDSGQLEFCRKRFKEVILPKFMNGSGGFPDELGRTKPYGYSIFHLDICAGIAQLLSTPADNLWTFVSPDGHGMGKGLAFLFPFLRDKSSWPFKHDVMYWDEWPVRQPSLLFGGLALNKPEYVALWMELKPEPTSEEGLRNWPIRQPLLWLKPEQALTVQPK